MTIFGRIRRALAGLNRDLGSAEGTAEGARGFNPAIRHVEAAEQEQFPPEEFALDEQGDGEQSDRPRPL